MISNIIQIPTCVLQDWSLLLLEVADIVRLDRAVTNTVPKADPRYSFNESIFSHTVDTVVDLQ